ncbi:hypothetical protein, partial [Mobiluncus mulieris]|uniref:hypothetical protein n=1 Tax=Mobiluncus mulieris TaxID=2052 RepID=UPI001B8CAEE0
PAAPSTATAALSSTALIDIISILSTQPTYTIYLTPSQNQLLKRGITYSLIETNSPIRILEHSPKQPMHTAKRLPT